MTEVQSNEFFFHKFGSTIHTTHVLSWILWFKELVLFFDNFCFEINESL